MSASTSSVTTSSVVEKKINNVSVKPFTITQAKKPPRHFDLFGMEPYPNIGIMAKKGSGKTSVLGTILTQSIGWGTEVTAFVPTGYNDKAWEAIRDYMRNLPPKLHNRFTLYTEIVNPETKVNHLEALLEEAKQISMQKAGVATEDEVDEDYSDVQLPMSHISEELKDDSANDDESDEEDILDLIEKKIARSKKCWPSRIIIFDDLSDDLRNKYVEKLLKTNRHLKAMIIISSHQLTDMKPASTQNLNFALLFQNIEERYVLKLRDRLGIKVEPEKFLQLYRHATAEKYHFFYIDVMNEKFRKDFNMALS